MSHRVKSKALDYVMLVPRHRSQPKSVAVIFSVLSIYRIQKDFYFYDGPMQKIIFKRD